MSSTDQAAVSADDVKWCAKHGLLVTRIMIAMSANPKYFQSSASEMRHDAIVIAKKAVEFCGNVLDDDEPERPGKFR